MKKYLNLAFIYAIIAMVFGVFYREYTKLNGFTGQTSLAFLHTHYFILGMILFLVFALLEKSLEFSARKAVRPALITYNIGLNITGLGFLLRGLNQVWGTNLSAGMDGAISGIAGIGHILLGISLLVMLVQIKKSCQQNRFPAKAVSRIEKEG